MLLWFAAVQAAAMPIPSVSASSWPEHPYAETSGSGVEVDGDLIVRNASAVERELSEISVDVHDAAGRLLQRKELNGNGTSPSIALVTDRTLPRNGALLVFNPFSRFNSDLEPARLDYRLTFTRKDGSDPVIATVSVTPRAEAPLRYGFPLRGKVLVWDGHDFASHHRRWNFLHPVLQSAGFKSTAARYSFDLIQVDAEGRRSNGDESRNENWLAFNQPVYAIASGEVVAVENSHPDDRNFDVSTVATPNAMYGNYVVLKHGDGSYSMYGHLRQASATVKAGARVHAGQRIARVGASGSAMFPHLHFQRMDGPTDRSEGIPTRFSGLKRPSGIAPANGFVDSGDVLVVE